MTKKPPATPRCPYCNATGLDKLASKVHRDIRVIFCGLCGAILGFVPYQIPEETKAKASADKPKPIDPDMQALAKKYGPKPKPLLKGSKVKSDLTKSELGAMLGASAGGKLYQIFTPNNEDD